VENVWKRVKMFFKLFKKMFKEVLFCDFLEKSAQKLNAFCSIAKENSKSRISLS